MPVALRRRSLGRLAQHTTRTRRHDDRCARVTLGDFIVDIVLIERAVTDEGYDWTRHLVEQSADLRAIVVITGRQPDRHDLTGVGVHAAMQLSPGPACPRAMLASRPGELHPGPLSEPYVRLSPHTAPIRRTRPQARPRFAAHTASSCCQLSGDAATRSNPFAPVPLQNLHRYYGSVRPSPLLRYSRLAVFAACASPLASEAWFLQFRAKACVRLTPPLRRSPSAQSSGSRRTCPRRLSRPWFRRHLSS